MKMFIPAALITAIIGFTGILSIFVGNVFLTNIAFIALTASSIIFLFIMTLSRNRINKNCSRMCDDINSMFNKSNELFDVFCLYFDYNYLLINTFDENENEINLIKSKYKSISELLHGFKNIKPIVNDTEKRHINSKRCGIIGKRIEILVNEEDEFINLLSNLKENLFIKMKEKITNTYDKKDLFHKLVVEYQLYSEIIYDFVHSIRGNIDETSKPLSEEIFIIRQNVYEFINKIRKWENDLTDNKTDKNFSNVISRYNTQNKEFQDIFDRINKNYSDMDSQFNDIINMIEKVYSNSFLIQDISEKIKLLSINASIEASHSDKSGKGFKVIAVEIKKLSEDTKTIVNNTVSLISDSMAAIRKTINDFSISGKEITAKVDGQKKDFNVFYDILKGYYGNFNEIFQSVTELTNKIAEHIDKFNPIFQMHDISIQELGNLNKMIIKFLDDNKDIIENVNSLTKTNLRNEILNELLSEIERKITTSNEIDVINSIYRKYDINKKLSEKETAEIDFF